MSNTLFNLRSDETFVQYSNRQVYDYVSHTTHTAPPIHRQRFFVMEKKCVWTGNLPCRRVVVNESNSCGPLITLEGLVVVN